MKLEAPPVLRVLALPARLALKVFVGNDAALELAVEAMLIEPEIGLRATAEKFNVDKDRLSRTLRRFSGVLAAAWVSCGLKESAMVVKRDERL